MRALSSTRASREFSEAGASATAEELSEHARKHLGANKYPRQITIVPAVPLTSVGKLDRKKLRQWVAESSQQLT